MQTQPSKIHILCIETANAITSVSITENDICLQTKDVLESNKAADVLHVLIEQLLAETKLTFKDIHAIAISSGPGSYTGLRIATAAAKGYCFALNIPLIAIPTLKAMTQGIQTRYNKTDFDVFVPMVDARRMEVFTAFLSKELATIKTFSSLIIDENTIELFEAEKKYLLFGNGAQKSKQHLDKNTIVVIENFVPSSKDLCLLAFSAFLKNEFEDIAYFEPNYTKPFFTTANK